MITDYGKLIYGAITQDLKLKRLSTVLLVPIAYTLVRCVSVLVLICTLNTYQAAKYHITNEAVIGALCIPVGVGNICTSSLDCILHEVLTLHVSWLDIRR